GRLIVGPTAPAMAANLPDPCSQTLADIQANVGLPLQGYAGASSAANLDSPRLACLNTSAVGYKANTAVLVVRRADTSVAAATPTSGFFNIQVSGCAGDPGKYVIDTDTNAGAYTMH